MIKQKWILYFNYKPLSRKPSIDSGWFVEYPSIINGGL